MEFELPGNEAIPSRDDGHPIIEAIRPKGLTALLDDGAPMDEALPETPDPPVLPEEIF